MKKALLAISIAIAATSAVFAAVGNTERIGAMGRNDAIVTGTGWTTLTNDIASLSIVTNGLASTNFVNDAYARMTNHTAAISASVASLSNAVAQSEKALTVTNGIVRNGNDIWVDPAVTNGVAYARNVLPIGGSGLIALNAEAGAITAATLTASAKLKSYGEVEDGQGNLLSKAAKASELKTVAFTGNYEDLSNKPIGGDYNLVTNYIAEVEKTVNTVGSTVNAWETYWDGSNVIWQVTNYYGIVDIPKLRLLELRDGKYREVWNDITKFAQFETGVVTRVSQEVTNLVENSSRNWGRYTSLSGELAPSNQVWINSAEAVFAAGLEYERVFVGNGSIAVLSAKGDVSTLGGANGSFRITSSDGTSYFGFNKTSSYTVGCDTDAIVVSGQTVTLRYDIIQNDPPVIYYKRTLSDATWTQLTSETSPAVQTSYTDGNWYALINVGDAPQGFFRAETTVEGSAVFDTNMPANLREGILCTDGETRVRPVNTNGTITWEIVQ